MRGNKNISMKRFLFCVILSKLVMPTYSQNNTEITDTLKKELKEVVVEGNRFVTTPNKIMIFANSMVKKHSYDGYSALSNLNVPGLKVSEIDRKVSSNGQGVLLCINGVEATQNEIKALNPKDIKRIDYYTGFDPRHPGVERVIDFIMKIRDYGGAVMVGADQNLNVETGNDVVDWKVYKKNAEFGLNVWFNHLHNNPDIGTNSERKMIFSDREITRISKSLPLSNHTNDVNFTFTYLQRFKKGVLKSSVEYNQRHASNNAAAKESYLEMSQLDSESKTDYHIDNSVPSASVMYDYFLKKGYLRVEMSGSYYSADSHRNYSALQTISSSTNSKGYKLLPKIMISIPIGNIFSPYAFIHYFYSKRSQDYAENNQKSEEDYSLQASVFGVGSNIKLHKNFNLTLLLQNMIQKENTGVNSNKYYSFVPNIEFNYNIPNYGQLGGMVGYSSILPTYGMSTMIEKKKDEFLYVVGNSKLKQQNEVNAVVSYTYPKKWGWMQVYSDYSNISNAVYKNYEQDESRNAYIQSYKNGKRFERFKLNYGIEYYAVPNLLSLSAGITYTHTSSYTDNLQKMDRLRFLIRTALYYKNFSAKLSFGPNTKNLTQDGAIVKNPKSLSLTAGYNYKSLSCSFFARNPFMKSYQEVILRQKGYSNVKQSYNPKLAYDYFAIRINYRFSYGKPHNFQKFNVSSEAKDYQPD